MERSNRCRSAALPHGLTARSVPMPMMQVRHVMMRVRHRRMLVRVDVLEAAGPLLHAAYAARRQALNDRALARALLAHPLLTLKVIAAIHWEALRLWTRGVPLQPRPARATESLTIVPAP